MTDSDQEIIERCLAGHTDEFRHLVRRYQRPLLAFLMNRLAARAHAEEAAQEAFVRAFCNLRKLRAPQAFFSWILGIANHVSDEVTRRERHAQQRQSPIEAAEHLPAGESRPSGDRPAIHAAVADLSDPLREVVLLRFYGDHSCKDISEQLGIPVSTVTKRLSRAYAQMRECLETAPAGE